LKALRQLPTRLRRSFRHKKRGSWAEGGWAVVSAAERKASGLLIANHEKKMVLRNRGGAQQATKSQSKSTENSVEGKPSDETSKWMVFSENPDKAWAEKFFLAYSPVWPALFGAWTTSGLHLHAGDFGNLAVTILFASPNVIVPLLFCPTTNRPFWETYWFKFEVWVGIFTFVASYFFTEYFFDILGMTYHFPHLSWNFDSLLVGSGKQVVPVMMYVHAWYFLITYHACSVVFIRVIRTAPLAREWPTIASFFSVIFAAWLFAWGEIFGTTLEAIKDQFTYKDMDWALSWGAMLYACYFVSSFPIVFPLDEHRGEHWTMWQTVQSALAAAMISFIMLDVSAQFLITEWKNKTF